MFNFRRVTRHQACMSQQQVTYAPQALPVTPTAERKYARFQLCAAEERITALIDLVEWCRHAWPEMESLAWECISEGQLRQLFSAEIEHHRFFLGRYVPLNIEVISGDIVQQPWLTVQEKRLGRVLLERAPLSMAPHPINIAGFMHLPLASKWILGTSIISASLLHTLALRDVLLIQNLLMQLDISGKRIARFRSQDDGVMVVEEVIHNELEPERIDIEDETMMEEQVLVPFDVSAISVTLTFVLGQRSITINELSSIQSGSQFALGQNTEKSVKVYANKQLIAEGELIYIDDVLGLEVTKMATMGSLE
ncbi:FliM/FliN family flagellar motor switch protein [Yersinia ruckeri]|uniref:FliM/FliN family flagellar motor switch protein n=1 Tax=Yersinia ruckeri TaxID=29486 RepID=UPI0020C0D9BA|nr:FliM/FliN family flagellar motor switch protein [Yersinia ruckeri]MCK8584327.1 FliM/FliN family flagellar motor switch protein [Yersinia ruckeri]